MPRNVAKAFPFGVWSGQKTRGPDGWSAGPVRAKLGARARARVSCWVPTHLQIRSAIDKKCIWSRANNGFHLFRGESTGPRTGGSPRV